MRNKKFKTFHKVGNNEYSMMIFDGDIFLGTKSVLEIPKFFKRTKKINQGFKVLELTAPISYLFNEVVSTKLINEDKEFPDMNTYEKVDAKKVRNDIKAIYEKSIEDEINGILLDFKNWCKTYAENNKDNLKPIEINNIISQNRNRLDEYINNIKAMSVLKTLEFKPPKIVDSKDLYSISQLDRLEFLYSQKVGSNLKFSYFYDLDDFGVITIYKIQTVKGFVKYIETFIYDRQIITKVEEYILQNNV